jgi:hypothetical protein
MKMITNGHKLTMAYNEIMSYKFLAKGTTKNNSGWMV